ncbi:hypothetical protein LWI28_011881 [Acer negundo]|uniref:RRM domain-containing protein n=1 Tax=Acer negundo TaxID=4023 RepID=A0AAD5IVF4_ACENE|nr:hypothetical protein LWI28_011881 [Acer negundo]
MVKKKSEGDNVSAPSSIFQTLFGGGADQNAGVSSIFSDNNPFKRKSQESESGFDSSENPKKSGSLDSDIADVKKTKRKKEKRSNLDQEAKNLDADVDVEGNGGSEKSKRKKRKRDEVEREYEEKMYGAKAKAKAKAKAEGEEEVGRKVVVGEKRKKADDKTEDTMVTTNEEGFDDENKLLRTVFVGNLPLNIKKKSLLKEFSKFGDVESVRIRSVPILDTKVPRKGAILKKQINDNVDSVHAYIVFNSEQSAEAALAHNMAVVGGNHVRVDRACPPRKKLKGENTPLYDNKRTVFVGNLPFDVKDEEIYQLFCGLNNLESSVEAVRVIRHSHMRLGKGIAYVLFKTREAANLVVKKRNLKVRDRELRISRAEKNSTPSKRANTSPASAFTSPAKKFAGDSRTPASANRSNSRTAMSYQGVQASKSGTQKKIHSGSSIGPVMMKKSGTQKGVKLKLRQDKRPAVALRKERVKTQDGGVSKQAGSKRKLDTRTPENFQRKKAKKFRSGLPRGAVVAPWCARPECGVAYVMLPVEAHPRRSIARAALPSRFAWASHDA